MPAIAFSCRSATATSSLKFFEPLCQAHLTISLSAKVLTGPFELPEIADPRQDDLARDRRIHPALDELAGAHLDVEGELFVDFLIERDAPEPRTERSLHSDRNASTGSTRVARHAGAAVAIAAVSARIRRPSRTSPDRAARRQTETSRSFGEQRRGAARPMTPPIGHHSSGAAEDQAHHACRRRTERDADAELTRALLDRIRQHAEDADHRQQQGQRRERADDHRSESMRCRGEVGEIGQRSVASDGHVAIDARDDLANGCEQRLHWSRGRLHHQVGVGPRKLRQRHEYLGRRFGFVEAVLQLSHDADDLSFGGWKESWYAPRLRVGYQSGPVHRGSGVRMPR